MNIDDALQWLVDRLPNSEIEVGPTVQQTNLPRPVYSYIRIIEDNPQSFTSDEFLINYVINIETLTPAQAGGASEGLESVTRLGEIRRIIYGSRTLDGNAWLVPMEKITEKLLPAGVVDRNRTAGTWRSQNFHRGLIAMTIPIIEEAV